MKDTDRGPTALAVVGLLMFGAGIWVRWGLGVMLTVVGALLMVVAALIVRSKMLNPQHEGGSGGGDPT